MASQRLTCPDCKSVLRPAKPVPDGKKVKCPKCGGFFTTPGLLEREPARKKPAAIKTAKETNKKPAAPKPPADTDEGDGIYSYIPEDKKAEEDKPDIEYAPDMSIKDLRGPAQAAVVSPSNYMLILGGLGCLSNLFLICVSFWPMVFSDSPVDWKKVLTLYYKDDKNAVQRVDGIKEYKDLKDKDLDIVQDAEADARLYRFIAMGVYIFLFLYNAVAIIGAVKMQNLESRGWGIASSIMTILPLSSGGLSSLVGGLFYFTIGSWVLEEMNAYYSSGISSLPYLFALFVGVWSLRTLMSQEVIDGFEYVAE